MVVALGPGKFYGNSLPRPYFYADTKHNGDGPRVDPPVTVLDPLLSWARDAHWSMGGLSFKRHRLQGQIEGNIKRLRKQEESKERRWKKQERFDLAKAKKERTASMQRLAKLEEEEDVDSSEEEQEEVKEEDLVLESEEEEEDGDDEEDDVDVAVVAPSPRPNKRVRKLEDEFEKVASGDWGSKAPCPSVRNTRASTTWKRSQASPSSPPPPPPVAAAATPTRRGKTKNAVVTPRRSSRISPGKKSGSV